MRSFGSVLPLTRPAGKTKEGGWVLKELLLTDYVS